MITKNLGRSYSGVGKYTYGLIPRPYNGDTGSGKVTTITENIGRMGNSVSFCQHGFLNSMSYSHGSTAGFNDTYSFKVSGPQVGNGFTMLDVGFGDTAESADDYKLENSNMQKVQRSTAPLYHISGKVYNGRNGETQNLLPDSDDGCMIRVEALYQNESPNTDVVVKEMGLIIVPSAVDNSGSFASGEASWFLIARKVLASPVTIHPGEIYKFTYKIKAF